MLSAHDVIHKHTRDGRYLYRAPEEERLCYQIAGAEPDVMAAAATKLMQSGADLIDINCGCPKTKIRKKGAGSALLEEPQRLMAIIKAVRSAIQCPLTVKIRLQVNGDEVDLAKKIADAGADALIIHGRRWIDDYDKPCDLQQIGRIKQAIDIPVIMNGDIAGHHTLTNALTQTGCDGFMIARASTGKPWLFQELLEGSKITVEKSARIALFMTHLKGLAELENEYQAVLQSKSLVRYYFREIGASFLQDFYRLSHLDEIKIALCSSEI
jgi:tRNA-dihydrouridine synthase B